MDSIAIQNLCVPLRKHETPEEENTQLASRCQVD